MVLNLLLAAGSLMSCTSDALLEPELPEYSIIQGDSVKTFKDLKKAQIFNDKRGAIVGDTVVLYTAPPKLRPGQTPALDNLKNELLPGRKGKPFRMVAIGGDLTQGKRDGGYFNEAMETAYPALIAQQMGVEFRNPLFNSKEYNGVGRRVYTTFNPTAGPVPKTKLVNNNIGADEKGVLSAYPQTEYDNYYMNSYLKGDWYKRQAGENYILNKWEKGVKDFDFMIVEQGFSDLTGNEPMAFNMMGAAMSWEFPTLETLKSKIHLEKGVETYSVKVPTGVSMANPSLNPYFWEAVKGLKLTNGVILNTPYLYHIPYYTANKVYAEKVQELMNIYHKNWFEYGKSGYLSVHGSEYEINEKGYGKPFLSNRSGFLPSSKLDSLLGTNVNIVLKPGMSKNRKFDINVVTASVISTLTELDKYVAQRNKQVEIYSRYTGMPVVDLNTLYEKIVTGGFVTDDGVKVDAAWPEGNFFSTDGIYPSAFGQAVIANETIKVINAHYKVKIELINTREFLKR